MKAIATHKNSMITCVFAFMICLVGMFIDTQTGMGRPHQDIGSLTGSAQSLTRQQRARSISGAQLHQTWTSAKKDVDKKRLVRIIPSKNLQLANVSYPYAHPKLKLLLQHLSNLYSNYCKTPLVVTSLLRPINKQPRNASKRSVHPAGLAADLRVPPPECRAWLRETLSAWERAQMIEATREKHPAHFHVVVMPHRINTQVLKQLKGRKFETKKHLNRNTQPRNKHLSRTYARTYRVKKGDSIWLLSRRWHVSQQSIMKANHLSSTDLQLGQVLNIPSL